MNDLSMTNLWLWGMLQATVLAVVSVLLLGMNRQMMPAHKAIAATVVLVAMVLMPLLLCVPTGQAMGIESQLPASKVTLPTPTKIPASTPAASFPFIEPLSEQPTSVELLGFIPNEWLVAASHVVLEQPDERHQGLRWQSLVIWFATFLVVVGLIRFIGGWIWVQLIQRHSRTIDDAFLDGHLQSLREALHVRPPIQVKECERVDTAAIVGYFSPTILLPKEWRNWSKQETQSILAHELAHQRRSDPAMNFLAQLALAFNFYNPIAHWLARSVRFNQELAADALAAKVSGGQQCYLHTLAKLALRQSSPRVQWSALTFLPSRQTFVRRLEMLRTLKLSPSRWSFMQAIASTALLGSLIVGLSFIKPVVAQESSHKASPTQSASDASLIPIQDYAHAVTAQALVFIDVDQLLGVPAVRQLVDASPDFQVWRGVIPLNEVEEVLVIVGKDWQMRPDGAAVVRLKDSDSVSIIQKAQEQFGPGSAATLDNRTILLGDSPTLGATAAMFKLAAKTKSKNTLPSLLKTQDVLASAAFSTSGIDRLVPNEAAMFAPLWQDVSTAAIEIEVDGNSLVASSVLNSQSAENVAETLQAARVLVKNFLNRSQDADYPLGTAAAQLNSMARVMKLLFQPSLEAAQISTADSKVTVDVRFEDLISNLTEVAIPQVQNLRQQSQEAIEMNNLRQIGLALHNYYAVYGHLPPSVIVENGVARSWRIELLPFLEQTPLYNTYRKDLPWDAPENKRVVETALPVFCHPTDGNKTHFRGLGGNKGALGSNGNSGVKFEMIRRGLSNTIAVVETADAIEWAKPEEFELTPEEIVELQTSNFMVLFADGSVRRAGKDYPGIDIQASVRIDDESNLTPPIGR